MPTWLLYALLSALAAAFVGILGKVGMKDIDSTLATAIRSLVMTLFLAIICASLKLFPKLHSLPPKSLAILSLSGVAGALSWLFYFRALQLGTVSQVAPIDKLSMPLTILLAVLLLKERPTSINWLGIGLIALGAYFAAATRK